MFERADDENGRLRLRESGALREEGSRQLFINNNNNKGKFNE
jgi:hypothetical protein